MCLAHGERGADCGAVRGPARGCRFSPVRHLSAAWIRGWAGKPCCRRSGGMACWSRIRLSGFRSWGSRRRCGRPQGCASGSRWRGSRSAGCGAGREAGREEASGDLAGGEAHDAMVVLLACLACGLAVPEVDGFPVEGEDAAVADGGPRILQTIISYEQITVIDKLQL